MVFEPQSNNEAQYTITLVTEGGKDNNRLVFMEMLKLTLPIKNEFALHYQCKDTLDISNFYLRI
jgi:hypothetical protein